MTITGAAGLLAWAQPLAASARFTLTFYSGRAKAIAGDKGIDLITATDLRAVLASCTERTDLPQ